MFYLVHSGTALQLVESDGSISTLTLPASGVDPEATVSVSNTLRARFGILGQHVVIINAPSENLWLDPLTRELRPLGILPPQAAPTLTAATATGTLTGEYRAKVSFAIKNEDGAIINESPLSGQSAAVTLTTSEQLTFDNIPVSLNPHVNCRRIYRTKAGGTVFFHAFDIDDNVTEDGVINEAPDAALDRQPSDPTLGNPPGTIPGGRLTLITEWKNRLFAVPSQYDLRDHLVYTDEGKFYAWPRANDFIIYPAGEDEFGITGLLRRRDALGILKRSRVLKLVGSSNDDFEVIIVVENLGCIAPESCVVIRDVGYFLADDGVYRWDDNGVVCISRANVDPWFTTGDYFNRAEFPRAVGGWNPAANTYELQLCAAGSTNLDRWVSFHLDKQEWLGPHLTDAATPTARALLKSDENVLRPVIGASDGHIYLQNQTGAKDVAAANHAIHAKVETKVHSQRTPNVDKHWGMLAVMSRKESAGSLTITPHVGQQATAMTALTALTHDVTKGREEVGRIATSDEQSHILMKLIFEQDAVDQQFLLFGYEVEEAHEDGVR